MTRIPFAAATQVERFESETRLLPYYDMLGAFLGVDLCAGVESFLIPNSVDRLLGVWNAVGVDGPREDIIDDPKNSFLRSVLFCGRSKLELVYHPRLATTEDDEIASLRSGEQPVIFVGADRPKPTPSSIEPPPDATDIQLQALHANEVELKVRNSAPDTAWLIYGDSYNPAWQAYVDGDPTPIYRANVAFKAVSIGPGTHDVKFVFKRGIFSIPWLLVGVTLIGLAGWICLYAATYIGREKASDRERIKPV
jgi:hypothetical protein